MSKPTENQFEKAVFQYTGPQGSARVRDYPDAIFKVIALALFAMFQMSKKSYKEAAIRLAEAFLHEIPEIIEKLNKDEAYLRDKKKFPGWKARRFAEVRQHLELWGKVLPTLNNLTRAYAYITKPWGFVVDGSSLYLESPEGAAWRMMREYAEAFKSGKIDNATGAAHGPLIMKALVKETGLISEADFKSAIKWAMGKAESFPTPEAAQTVADSDGEEDATTNLGKKIAEAGITAADAS